MQQTSIVYSPRHGSAHYNHKPLEEEGIGCPTPSSDVCSVAWESGKSTTISNRLIAGCTSTRGRKPNSNDKRSHARPSRGLVHCGDDCLRQSSHRKHLRCNFQQYKAIWQQTWCRESFFFFGSRGHLECNFSHGEPTKPPTVRIGPI